MNILIVFRNIFFLFVWAFQRESMNSPCNAILLSVILHQKVGLNFFDVLVSDRKHIFKKTLQRKIDMLSCLKLFLHPTSDFTLSHNHCLKLDEHTKNKQYIVDSRRNVP